MSDKNRAKDLKPPLRSKKSAVTQRTIDASEYIKATQIGPRKYAFGWDYERLLEEKIAAEEQDARAILGLSADNHQELTEIRNAANSLTLEYVAAGIVLQAAELRAQAARLIDQFPDGELHALIVDALCNAMVLGSSNHTLQTVYAEPQIMAKASMDAGAREGGKRKARKFNPTRDGILAFMKGPISNGMSVLSAGDLAHRKNLGTSARANAALWWREQKRKKP